MDRRRRVSNLAPALGTIDVEGADTASQRERARYNEGGALIGIYAAEREYPSPSLCEASTCIWRQVHQVGEGRVAQSQGACALSNGVVECPVSCATERESVRPGTPSPITTSEATVAVLV
jgi:hypothetical protein